MPKQCHSLLYNEDVPRQRNHVPTQTFKVSTTPQVVSELERLVETGHFGKNIAEAAERIISSYLHEAFGSSTAHRIPRRKTSEVR
jgi:hypothetical protein